MNKPLFQNQINGPPSFAEELAKRLGNVLPEQKVKDSPVISKVEGTKVENLNLMCSFKFSLENELKIVLSKGFFFRRRKFVFARIRTGSRIFG